MGIEKHIKVTGTSDISWKDAIIKTVESTSRSITNLTSVKVLDQRAKITQDKMTMYYVDLDITFMVQPS